MTEQEAIKDIQRQLLEINSEDADITLSTEALNVAIKALEKQIAKKPIERIKMIGLDKGGKCPVCQKYVNNHNHWLYCECGQKLDWE